MNSSSTLKRTFQLQQRRGAQTLWHGARLVPPTPPILAPSVDVAGHLKINVGVRRVITQVTTFGPHTSVGIGGLVGQGNYTGPAQL